MIDLNSRLLSGELLGLAFMALSDGCGSKKNEKKRKENPKVCKGNTDMFKNCLQVVVLVCRKSKPKCSQLSDNHPGH